MESKIISTVQAWLPHCVNKESSESEYEVLQHVAAYCLENFEGSNEDQQMAREAIHVIGILYGGGSLHIKNAIENEFLERMATSESPSSLKKHLTFFPKEMRSVYVKTIIEN